MMLSADWLLSFLAATLLLAYMPGPGTLYAAAQTVALGRRAGLMAALGLHIGGYLHVIAAAIGLSALFHAVPALYLLVKLLGAAYLIWLGGKMIWHASVNRKQEVEPVSGSQKTGRRAFFESVFVEALNPKTALFFIAFLPQFVVPAAHIPVWLQFLLLGTFVNIAFSSADLVCVYFAGIVVDKLRQSSRTGRLLEAIGGSILFGLGANLALQHN